MTIKQWIHGIAAAAIGAGATAISAIVIDPAKFNLTLAGMKSLGELAAASAIIAVAAYLKQFPLPGDPQGGPSPTH